MIHTTDIDIIICGCRAEYSGEVYHDETGVSDTFCFRIAGGVNRYLLLTDDQRDAIAAEIRMAARDDRAESLGKGRI